MHLRRCAALAALLVAMTAHANAERATGRYFDLSNGTHDSVVSLAVAPAGSAEFREIVIGKPLHGGNTATTVWIDGNECLRDFRVEFRDGRTLVYRDVDVCRYRRLRMTARDGLRR